MSHDATAWAIKVYDVPLEERMVLIYLADCHCPDNGCLVRPERLAAETRIELAELRRLLDSLEARGKIARVGNTERWLFEYEPLFASFAGRTRQ